MLLPKNTVERLSQYRRMLLRYKYMRDAHIFSHDIARLLGLTSSQVRRDLMLVGAAGNHRKGYNVSELIKKIGHAIDSHDIQNVALIGIGNLGKAVTSYLSHTESRLKIVAAFDIDPKKINQHFGDVYCYDISSMPQIIDDMNVTIGVLTVPPEYANDITNVLVNSGIKGILNFTPVKLDVPAGIYLKEHDIITALEEIAYFTKTT